MKFTKEKIKNGSNQRPLERDGRTDGRTLINCVDLTNYVEVLKSGIIITNFQFPCVWLSSGCADVLTLIGILFPFLIEKSGLLFLLTNSCCCDKSSADDGEKKDPHSRHSHLKITATANPDHHKHHHHAAAEHSAPLLAHDDLANDACCTEVESDDTLSIVSVSSDNSESCRTGTVQVGYISPN